MFSTNPIQADIWFTQNSLGGGPGNLPSSISLLWYKSITYDTCLESPWLNLNNLPKVSNLQKKYIYFKIKFLSKKCAKTISQIPF